MNTCSTTILPKEIFADIVLMYEEIVRLVQLYKEEGGAYQEDIEALYSYALLLYQYQEYEKAIRIGLLLASFYIPNESSKEYMRNRARVDNLIGECYAALEDYKSASSYYRKIPWDDMISQFGRDWTEADVPLGFSKSDIPSDFLNILSHTQNNSAEIVSQNVPFLSAEREVRSLISDSNFQPTRLEQEYCEAVQRMDSLSNQIDNYIEQQNYCDDSIRRDMNEKAHFDGLLSNIEDTIRELCEINGFLLDAVSSPVPSDNSLYSIESTNERILFAGDAENGQDENDTSGVKRLTELLVRRRRIIQAIADIDRRIQSQLAEKDMLRRKIDACSAERLSIRKSIINIASEMAKSPDELIG